MGGSRQPQAIPANNGIKEREQRRNIKNKKYNNINDNPYQFAKP